MTPREELHANIDELRSLVKSGELDTKQTIERVQVLTDQYVEHTGERPDTGALERMATLILDEDLTNKDRMKSRSEEYPVLSETQEARRKTGAHARRGSSRELSDTLTKEVGSDGVDYRPQTRDTKRKMREVTRTQLQDKYARSRNKERRRKYREFTKRQPVITYYLPGYPR